jgi:hypothetical protein
LLETVRLFRVYPAVCRLFKCTHIIKGQGDALVPMVFVARMLFPKFR